MCPPVYQRQPKRILLAKNLEAFERSILAQCQTGSNIDCKAVTSQALCTEASLVALRRSFPQIYSSDDKLLVDPSAVQVLRQDFDAALRAITPASGRAVATPARSPSPPGNPTHPHSGRHPTSSLGQMHLQLSGPCHVATQSTHKESHEDSLLSMRHRDLINVLGRQQGLKAAQPGPLLPLTLVVETRTHSRQPSLSFMQAAVAAGSAVPAAASGAGAIRAESCFSPCRRHCPWAGGRLHFPDH